MVNEDANSHMVGRAMSEIGRSFKQRLLALAEEQVWATSDPLLLFSIRIDGTRRTTYCD